MLAIAAQDFSFPFLKKLLSSSHSEHSGRHVFGHCFWNIGILHKSGFTLALVHDFFFPFLYHFFVVSMQLLSEGLETDGVGAEGVGGLGLLGLVGVD